MEAEQPTPAVEPEVILQARREPYKHPLTDRLNAELRSRGLPTTRQHRRKALNRLKRLLTKQQRRAGTQDSA